MSQRLVHELKGSLSQVWRFAGERNYNLQYIRPFLFVFGMPSGTFALKVKDGAEELGSVTFTAADLKTALGTSDDYFYAWFRLNFSDKLSLKKGNYTVELSIASGYTFNESAWIGWISEHEFLHNDIDYTPQFDKENPLSTQFFVHGPGVNMTRIADLADGASAVTPPMITGATPSVTGSPASPSTITAGTGITISDVAEEIIFCEGNGGAVDITANPQIGAPTTAGQRVTLIGTSDTNTIKLEDGDGLEMNGTFILQDQSVIRFAWDGTVWVEEYRK